ncbi:hypothetical protein FGO68_gene9365 [Halteria grandinella]|uniref:Uncharacterized protein n=1 Tax=Halteria grandinella TaxID=5974 RepID=A0A8J8T890_HALGN|nr:hypothetical protein FGO68_gene9365 [Halteria grandinella]
MKTRVYQINSMGLIVQQIYKYQFFNYIRLNIYIEDVIWVLQIFAEIKALPKDCTRLCRSSLSGSVEQQAINNLQETCTVSGRRRNE